MPRGFTGVRSASEDIEQRKNSGGGGGFLYFKLANSGDTATVRFLEQGEEIFWSWVHEVPVAGRQYPQDVPCLDQQSRQEPCPGCERELKRKFKGFINLIWRNAPKLKRDAEGKGVKDGSGNWVFEGTEDQLAVWGTGITVFEELGDKDATYKGLMSRDFKVTRRGTGLQTRYSIDPADVDSGPQPMTTADMELAQNKTDLTPLVTPPTYTEFPLVGGGQVGPSVQSSGGANRNPFLRDRS